MKYITKDENISLQDKPKVFFTCHPDDVKLYFKKISDMILHYADCVVFYEENPDKPEDEENFLFDLTQMNLIVIPVTAKFLYQPCKARQEVLRIAIEKHIALLPILEDSSMESEFNRICGNLHLFKMPNASAVQSEAEKKLKKYLESVLISNELMKEIRSAFDSYIFLSYRKKDRKYANELMKLIHQNDELIGTAIWYDEFLLPGENFNVSIENALKKSELFTMLVTPNLVQENNYVMEVEYPMAVREDKKILPAEMQKTDASALKKYYNGLPDSIDARNPEKFRTLILDMLSSYRKTTDKISPYDKYLLGMAYLKGVDVEINVEIAVQLLTESAEAKCTEAIEELVDIYGNGEGVSIDYYEVLKWYKKLSEIYEKTLGTEHPDTATYYNNIGCTYNALGKYDKALEYYKKALEIYKKVFGTEHSDTAMSYNNIGIIYDKLGEYDKALEYHKKSLEISEKLLRKEHPDTAIYYNNIGCTYNALGKYDKALKYYKKALEINEKIFETEHPDTATYYNNIGVIYDNLGEYYKALEYNKKALEIDEKVLGTEHPDTAMSYNNIGIIYDNLGEYDEALEYYKKALEIDEKVLGTEHPCTAKTYNNIGLAYGNLGEYDKALKYHEKSLIIKEKVFGTEHSETASSYNNIGSAYGNLGEYDKALEYIKKALEIYKKVFGTEHPDTASSYDNIGSAYGNLGEYDKALEYHKKALKIRKRIFGTKHPDTAMSYNNIGIIYDNLGEYDEALKYYEKSLMIRKKVLGTEHPDTATSYNNIGSIYNALGEYDEALEYYEKALEIYKKVLDEDAEIITELEERISQLMEEL